MSTVPDARLLRAAALWTAAALAAVAAPALAPVLAAGGAVLGAFVLADLWLLRREPAPVLTRRLPERAYLGRSVDVALALSNPAGRPLRIDVLEALPEALVGRPTAFAGVAVPAGGSARVTYALEPLRRGDHALGAPIAWVRSPLGWLRRAAHGPDGQLLPVYPDTTPLLRPEALDPRRALAALGVRPARPRGEGMEFESLRDYVPGDDPRRLDWAASARRARPVVRLHRHERHHTLVVALDASRLMAARAGGRTKLDCTIDAGLALAHAGLVSGDRVAMALFDAELRGFVAPRAHRREFGSLLELVGRAQPRLVEADFQALVRGLALRQRQRALVVVLTDFVEADAAALSDSLVVLARRHQVLLVAVRDPLFRELEPGGATSPDGVYRRIVLDDLLHDREVALAGLRRRGLQTLDLEPTGLVAPVLNRYLALRYGAEG